MTEYVPRLPAAPRPPDDPLHYLLNQDAGWRASKLTHVETVNGLLQLAPAAGSGRLLVDPAGTFGGLALPTGVAADPCQGIYLLDPASGLIKRFDPCQCSFVTLPCIGGFGFAPRQVRDPHGIAICGGDLFVCDTGNHRVQVFALNGLMLRAIWGPLKVVEAPKPHVECVSPQWVTETSTTECAAEKTLEWPAGTWKPFDIAFDAHGRAFVTDLANSLVHRFDRRGSWQMSFGGVNHPTHLAIDRSDRIYIMQLGENKVLIFNADGKKLGDADRPEPIARDFCSPGFATDVKGNLYLGDLCLPVPNQCTCAAEMPALAGTFNLHGDSIILDPKTRPALSPAIAYEPEGGYFSEPLDSEIYRCQWHRALLGGDVPEGTSVKVLTFTAEITLEKDDLEDLPASAWSTQRTATGTSGCWDCLITSPPGRYLYLRLVFKSNGRATPSLRRVKVYFPRISLRRFLPAVFGENPASADFTDRLLSVFDTVQRSVETKVDNFARYLDPMSASAIRDGASFIDFLSWMGSWMGMVLDRSWNECTRRRVLQQAHCLHRLRGTPEGLRRLLLLYLGWNPFPDCRLNCKPSASAPGKTCSCRVPTRCECRALTPGAPPLILEHFKLRRWLFVGGARLGDQSTLWGTRLANRSILDESAQLDLTKTESSGNPRLDPFNLFAHKFSVFVPAGCARSPARKAVLQRLIASIKPAHTQHRLELVEPRFRIGIQSSIGFDAVVGRYPAGFTLAENRLGRNTLLAEKHPSGPDLEIGVESRIGSSTILD